MLLDPKFIARAAGWCALTWTGDDAPLRPMPTGLTSPPRMMLLFNESPTGPMFKLSTFAGFLLKTFDAQTDLVGVEFSGNDLIIDGVANQSPFVYYALLWS